MSMHYTNKKIEDMTPEMVLAGWKYHGKKLPSAYMIASGGDTVAYNCWCYFAMLKNNDFSKLLGFEKMPTIDEFCKPFSSDKLKEKIKEIILVLEKNEAIRW